MNETTNATPPTVVHVEGVKDGPISFADLNGHIDGRTLYHEATHPHLSIYHVIALSVLVQVASVVARYVIAHLHWF